MTRTCLLLLAALLLVVPAAGCRREPVTMRNMPTNIEHDPTVKEMKDAVKNSRTRPR